MKAFWTPVYFWISFNRRMLAGFAPPQGGFNCEPPLHRGFWIALLAIAALAGWGAVRSSAAALGHPGIAAGVLAGLPWLWWAAGALRTRSVDAILKIAGNAAASSLAASVVLMLGLLIPGIVAAWAAHALAAALLLIELRRRRWVIQRPHIAKRLAQPPLHSVGRGGRLTS